MFIETHAEHSQDEFIQAEFVEHDNAIEICASSTARCGQDGRHILQPVFTNAVPRNSHLDLKCTASLDLRTRQTSKKWNSEAYNYNLF